MSCDVTLLDPVIIASKENSGICISNVLSPLCEVNPLPSIRTTLPIFSIQGNSRILQVFLNSVLFGKLPLVS
ncbi:unnamed protein product [Rhizophagus irregularis]|nr:unnamed protein product [Rhizophagus irregularis]CAB5200963.1 unnamed protein product [Rhizophagus irregularis]